MRFLSLICVLCVLNLSFCKKNDAGLYNACEIEVNGNTYLFGGFSYEPTDNDFIFHNELILVTSIYLPMGTTEIKPAGRSSPTCIYHEGYIYISGGFSSFEQEYHYNDIWRYNLNDHYWELVDLQENGADGEGLRYHHSYIKPSIERYISRLENIVLNNRGVDV